MAALAITVSVVDVIRVGAGIVIACGNMRSAVRLLVILCRLVIVGFLKKIVNRFIPATKAFASYVLNLSISKLIIWLHPHQLLITFCHAHMAALTMPRTFGLLAVVVIVPGVIVSIGRLPMSLVDAAGSGSELTLLEALRDDLARQLEDCDSSRDYAALSLRLMDAVRRISELQGEKPVERGSVLDELAKQRDARIARAKG